MSKVPITVSVPGGVPTGQVFNGTDGFVISSGSASGAPRFLFASGTIWWIGHLHPVLFGTAQSEFVHQTTLNVLRAFGTGPAGTSHPSVPNGTS